MNSVYRRLMAAQRSDRLFAGRNARIHAMGPFGRVLRFEGDSAGFPHPWAPDLIGNTAATLLPGTVNNMQATIKGVPLAGTEKKAAPRLDFGDKLMLTKDGIGYLCLEVTCDPKADWAVLTAEIVQVADPDTDDGLPGKVSNASGAAFPLSNNRARWALNMLQKRKGGQLDVFEIVMSNLTHRVKFGPDGITPLRHFFY